MNVAAIAARQFIERDPLMQLYKKNHRLCEKIEVYSYLLDLAARDEGTKPDSAHRFGFDGYKSGYCTQCGKYVDEGDHFCSNCGERLLWDEVKE